MNFKDLLLERKTHIVKKWFDLIIENYPADASNFLKKQKNQFLNPVGHTISEVIDCLFDGLINNADSDKFYPFLNDIIKIKAVQDFSPSQALSFVFLLKKVIREELKREISGKQLSEELMLFESRIDNLALLSFEIYVKCRERIHELRVNEIRNITFRLLQRANLVYEIQEQESDLNAEKVLTQNIKG